MAASDGGSGYESDASLWRDRTLAAVRAQSRAATPELIVQQVAALYADQFGAADYAFDQGEQRWRRAVLRALESLTASGLVETTATGRVHAGPEPTQAAEPVGAEAPPEDAPGGASTPPRPAAEAAPPRPAAQAPPPEPGPAPSEPAPSEPAPSEPAPIKPAVPSGVISAPMRTARGRSKSGMADDEALDVMVELNLGYEGGPRAALRALAVLWEQVTGREGPDQLSDEYATGVLSLAEMKRLVAADSTAPTTAERTIYRVWPDFTVRKLIDATAVTVKAEAAQRSFNSFGEGIVWAVVDSGIDAGHPHFAGYETLEGPAVDKLHRSFLPDLDGKPDDPLVDDDGHGTHVAGIIAGGLRRWDDDRVVVTESVFNVENPDEPLRAPRTVAEPKEHLNGMAPKAKLASLKVLGAGGNVQTRVSRVIAALAYVREVNAASDRLPKIHGVNLSLGYDFDPTWFACGQSPLCLEVDKLVRSGVVVVVAAGNSGYGTLSPKLSTVSQFGMAMTINDPGNAERAITVGATHRDAPHRYGVSYFSSKGPTGDGRAKPDVVAPGERIVSAAAGEYRDAVSLTPEQEKKAAVYVEDTGTSMAAPHVSGVVAAFLSVNREFIGQPERVKRIFMDSATPLGRDRYFQGAGLIDLMRALQSV